MKHSEDNASEAMLAELIEKATEMSNQIKSIADKVSSLDNGSEQINMSEGNGQRRDVDAIVKAVSKDVNHQQGILVESLQDYLDMLQRKMEASNLKIIGECSKGQVKVGDVEKLTKNVEELKGLSRLGVTMIDTCSKSQLNSREFNNMRKDVAELKELSLSSMKIAQRIEQNQKEKDSRVKIPVLLFYCLTTTFVFLILFFCLCIWANIEVIHNEKLSYCLYLIGGMIVFMNAAYIGVYRWLKKE